MGRTTRDDLRAWLERGKAQNARWMIVACDTFSYEDFPVFVEDDEAAFWKEYDAHDKPDAMLKIMEVYDYRLPLEDQLAEHRARHIPERPKKQEQP
jgi:hypothetical protein